MQEELFDTQDDYQASFNKLVDDIQVLGRKIAVDFEYPEETFWIYRNETKSGVNYPVQIRERRREQDGNADQEVSVQTSKEGMKLVYVCTPVMTLRECTTRSDHPGCVRLDIGTRVFLKDALPRCDEIKEVWSWNDVDDEARNFLKGEFRKWPKKDKSGNVKEIVDQIHELSHYQVFFDVKASELLPYIEKLLRARLKKYTSTASAYGCCHLYKECSAAGKCVSRDKLYATACQYRRNLEAGKRFY